MIYLFEQWDRSFNTMGIATLHPTLCDVTEEAGGEYSLELEHPLDPDGVWRSILPSRIIWCPVPVADTPPIDAEGSITVGMEIWMINNSGTEFWPSIPVRTTWHANHTYSRGARVIYEYYYYSCSPMFGDYSNTSSFNSDGAWRKLYRAVNPTASLAANTRLYVSASEGSWLTCKLINGMNGYVLKENATYIRTATQEDIDALSAEARMIQNQAFRIKSVEVNTQTSTVRANAEHVSYDYADQVVGVLDVENESIPNAVLDLQTLILPMDGEDVPLIHCEDNGNNITASYTNKSPVEAILDPENGMVAQSLCRLVRDNWEFFMVPNDAKDRGYRITWGVNLLGVRWKRDISNIATRVIPVGKAKDGGNLYIDDYYIISDNDSKYAVHHYELYQRSYRVGADKPEGGKYTVEEVKQLLEEDAEKRFTEAHVDEPKVTVEVDFVMLGTTEEYRSFRELERVSLYDTVTVFCPDLDLNVSAQVKSYRWDAILERYKKITLGDVFAHETGTVSGYDVRTTALDLSKITPKTISELSEIMANT